MSNLKVYMAGPFSEGPYINERAKELRAAGIEITARWITLEKASPTNEERMKYAGYDRDDVAAADILVLFTDPTKTHFRAGRHVEFGIAVGIGLSRPFPIFVVGPEYENIFHYLAEQVTHFDTWEQAKARLLHIQTIATRG